MFKQIGRNIRVLRKRNNLSQADLGVQLDLSRQQIAHYEKGNKTIPLTSITALSEIFNISIDHLIKLDLSDLTNDEFTALSKNSFDKPESFDPLQERSSNSVLDNYFKQIIKNHLKPVEDLLQKLLIKIDLTDLKYELGEEIKKANQFIEENETNNFNP
ncbi:helix-turn-helix domain-containing protein [Aquimarina aggregata]|uniref:helix-turn-helix domain-containing protein n=1 Tax=Aquimarina aggregata TaxID=1642818 RepID=UPI002490562C|nr:helix-turn-helix transcriptional regulator [Aquimarina aggregata]